MIGVFDSGVGGLYTLRELRRLLPDADLAYFADEAHLPYGGRGADDLLRVSSCAIRVLRAAGADAIVAACGTVSSTVLSRLAVASALPLFGAAMPLAQGVTAFCRYRDAPRVLLLATEGTVRARAIETLVLAECPHATVRAMATPAFVPLAERLCRENEVATARAVAAILSPLSGEHFDLAALGCTHFSALAPMITRALGGVPTLDGAALAARAAARSIPQKKQGADGRTLLFTSGDPRAFARAAARILKETFPVLGVDEA